MKKSLLVVTSLFFVINLLSCNNDDDDGSTASEVLADRNLQAEADDAILKTFMDSYTYNDKEFEGEHELNDQDIEFYKLPDSGGEELDSDMTSGTTLSALAIEYPITYEYETGKFITQSAYVIKVREGGGNSVYETSSVNTTYDMRIINSNTVDDVTTTTIASESLDERTSKIWFSNYNLVRGVKEASTLFNGATPYNSTNDCQVFGIDGNGELLTNNDFGIGIILLPSGLAYFNGGFYSDDEIEDITVDGEVQNLDSDDDDYEAYRKLVYTFSIYNTQDQDLDRDGIFSNLENGMGDDDEDLDDYDTDNDGTPNYLDVDDDNDGVFTFNEIFIGDKDLIDEYGQEKEFDEANATDSDCDGIYSNDNDVHFLYTADDGRVLYIVPGENDDLIVGKTPYHLNASIEYEQ